MAVIGGILALIYYTESKSERTVIETNEINNIQLLKERLAGDFENVVSDLNFLSDMHGLNNLLKGHTQQLDGLLNDFLSLSRRRKVYDQIRYLDSTGTEVVRVNFNKGQPAIVPTSKLQNKGKRYYFKDAFELDKGVIFVSPLDLNIERGQIEQPLKPMIRFGTPVFDDHGNKRGIVLLNYLGGKMLRDLARSSQSMGNTMLLNAEGYFLKGTVAQDEWGFMYKDRKHRTFGNMYPQIWKTIQTQDSGNYDSPAGLFTFATLFPLTEAQKSSTGSGEAYAQSSHSVSSKEYFWKIVTLVPPPALKAASTRILDKLFRLFIILILISAVGSWFLTSLSMKQKKAREDLQGFAEKLAKSNRELEEFAYIASHDLQEPLRKVMAFGDRLKSKYADQLGAQGQDYIDRMQNATRRMQTLINDLLTYSRVATEKQPFEEVDLKQTASEVLSDLEVRIADSDAKIDLDTLPTVKADPMQMRQLFQNLIGNAFKFSKKDESPIIKIGMTQDNGSNEWAKDASSSGDFCHITVKDNGIGFDQKYADQIFGTFRRLHGRQEYEGTGIGLAICQKIVKRHGGQIRASSQPGQGAEFFVTLPRAQ